MKMIALLPFLGLAALLAGCAGTPAPEPSDPGPWLEGVATPEPVDPASYPYVAPPRPEYPPEMEIVRLRELAPGTGMEDERLPDASGGSRAGYREKFEADYLHDERGVWYEGDYYPGACFMPGDWSDLYFEEDGLYVPGGVLLGCPHLYDPSIPAQPYRGHHGMSDSGYDELKRIRRPAGSGASRGPARTGPAPGHELPRSGSGTPPEAPPPPPAAREEPPAEPPPAKTKSSAPRAGRTRNSGGSGTGGAKEKPRGK